MNKPEQRAFKIQDLNTNLDEQTKYKTIKGHAAVFGQTVDIGGKFEEIIERSAFNNCDLSDVIMCINHDTNMIPIARCKNNSPESTLKLSIDDQGLAISATLDVENNQEARTLVSAIERGDIDGMSFLFSVEEQRWEKRDKNKPLRKITKIAKVYEAGPVNMPAYSNTDISARSKPFDNYTDTEIEKEKLKLKISLLQMED